MDNRINDIRRKIRMLREHMLKVEASIRGQINHDLDCTESSIQLMAMRREMVSLIGDRDALGGRETLPNIAESFSKGLAGAVYGALLGGVIALGFIAVRRLRPANGPGASMAPVMKTWIPYGVALGLGTLAALALELTGRISGVAM